MKQQKKSPLKAKPLRYVAQSLDERIDSLTNEHALSYFMVCVIMIYSAGYEWRRYYKNPTPSSVLHTIIAAVVILFSTHKLWKIKKKLKSLKLGRDGERAVGQYLESLREKGHRVFHDLLGENFNIDHVIVSKKGVFVVETKTYSKPYKGAPKIIFDGEKLTINGIGRYSSDVSVPKLNL